ncbi:type VII secretion protein EssB [Lacticaseibacillus zeae]|uniref:Type VII secretion protein EssB n=1 Tax=Lacticaseibacillus zeae TaxID=57037 RepID=A0A5R8LWX7_LACZE|nr:type VII secretion protein EssB [Lacticaseibacillus zeae]
MKRVEKTIKLNGDELHLQYENGKITVAISRAQVSAAKNELEAGLTPDANLLSGTVTVQGDNVIWTYQRPAETKTIDELRKQLSRVEQLALLSNLAQLEKFEQSRVTVLIHPNNLVFDESFVPFVVHRGLRDIVPPKTLTAEQLLSQYKAFVLYVIANQRDFEQMAQGDFNRVRRTSFNQSIIEAADFTAVKAFVDKALATERERTRATNDIVPKRRYRFYRYGFYTALVAVIALIGVTVYFTAFKVPFDDRMQASQKSYLSADYDAVINDLKHDQPAKLPKAEQYILATAYINTEGLSSVQKKNVLKNVSLQSDQNYLKFWIYNGRGDFKQALSLAQYIGDNQLILYIYTKLYEEANTNTSLTGDQKQTQLAKYQKLIDSYKKKLGGSANGLSK